MAVQFFSADIKAPTIPRKKLKQFIQHIFTNEKMNLDELVFVFCSDEYLLNINRQFLQHDYYTDIITFDISEELGEVRGEVYISIDRVIDNAKQLQLPTREELLRVIFHGALHLCGYNDKSKIQQKVMRKKEDYYLQLFHK